MAEGFGKMLARNPQGEEFAVLRCGAPQPLGSTALARRISAVLGEPFDLGVTWSRSGAALALPSRLLTEKTSIRCSKALICPCTVPRQTVVGAQAIVRSVTGLGVSLGMAVTAEGIETLAQLDAVRAQGCVEMQGYLFNKPRPVADIARLPDELPQFALVAFC